MDIVRTTGAQPQGPKSKKGNKMFKRQLPILSYRRRISDPMWTIWCWENRAAQVITGR